MARTELSRLASVELQRQALKRLQRGLGQTVIAAASIALLTLACMIAARRLAGGLAIPLGPGSLLVVAGVLSAIATLMRVAVIVTFGERRSWPEWGLLIVPSLTMLLLANSLSLPKTAVAGLIAIWGIIGLHEAAWLAGFWWRIGRPLRWGRRQTVARLPSAGNSILSPDAGQSTSDVERSEFDGRLTQILQRGVDEQGNEMFWGTIRADFAAGQRSQSLHLAFCPPFDSLPELTVDRAEGPAANVSVAEVQSYGARIEVRLGGVLPEVTEVTLEFYARQAG